MARVKNAARAWNKSFTCLRDDERGVESTKVILILVIVVLGFGGAFFVLKSVVSQKIDSGPECINGSNGEDC